MSEDHNVIKALIRIPAPPTSPLSEADADLLAAYVAGTLDEGAGEHVEARLADDDELRAAWLALAAQPQPVRAPSPLHPLLRWIASAAALIAVVLSVWALSRPSSPPALERLSARLEGLQQSAPDLFFDVRVLTAGELSVGPRSVERSGLELRGPPGRIVETSPELAWVLPLGATSALLRIEEEASGEVVLETPVKGERYALTPSTARLHHGKRYLWTVQARGSLGDVRGSAVLEIASEDLIERHRARLRALGFPTAGDASPSDPLDGLLAIHAALRADLWHEARTLLERVQPTTADEREHTRALRALIEARLGADG